MGICIRAFHSATGDGRRPHVSLRHRPLHMRQHRRCPTPLNLKALISFVLANVLPADYTTTIMLLLFLLLRVRTIRLPCSRSSQRRRRHFKTRQSRPSTFLPPRSCYTFLSNPAALLLPTAVVRMATHILLVGVRHQRRCSTVVSLPLDPRLRFTR